MTGGRDEAILRETLSAVWTAWWRVRLPGRGVSAGALLPPVAPGGGGGVDAERLLRRVDRIVRVAAFWAFRRRCFYRAFAAATLLRRRGVPAGLDFGLRLSGHRRRQCHCWVTIRGRPLGEETDPLELFPQAFGGDGGAVRYWLADEGEEQGG